MLYNTITNVNTAFIEVKNKFIKQWAAHKRLEFFVFPVIKPNATLRPYLPAIALLSSEKFVGVVKNSQKLCSIIFDKVYCGRIWQSLLFTSEIKHLHRDIFYYVDPILHIIKCQRTTTTHFVTVQPLLVGLDFIAK